MLTEAGMLGVTVIGGSLKAFGSEDTSSQPDPVLAAVLKEVVALNQRAAKDPRNPEVAREYASLARLIDTIATAHDLKPHMKRVRAREADQSTSERLATRLRSHGVATTGDEMLRRHFSAMSQLSDPVAAKRQALASITSGLMFQHQAELFESVAANMAQRGIVGAQFRETSRGPAFDTSTLTVQSWCDFFASWGWMFSLQGFMLAAVPPLELLALLSEVLGLGFSTYVMFFC